MTLAGVRSGRLLGGHTKSYQKSATSMSLIGSADLPEPALLIRTSAVPNSDLMSANRPRTAFSLRISTERASTETSGLIFWRSCVVASSSVAFRAMRTIAFAPAFANEAANAYVRDQI